MILRRRNGRQVTPPGVGAVAIPRPRDGCGRPFPMRGHHDFVEHRRQHRAVIALTAGDHDQWPPFPSTAVWTLVVSPPRERPTP